MKRYYTTSSSTQLAYDIFIQMTFGQSGSLSKSPSDLKNLCKRMSKVLRKTIELNTNTDKKHLEEINGALEKLDISFKDKDFEPLYIVGLFKLIFLLLGDLPNNWSRKTNINRSFFLHGRRQLVYNRNLEQKVTTILRAHEQNEKFQKIINRWDLSKLFRTETHKDILSQDFLRWYSDNYPNLYAELF